MGKLLDWLDVRVGYRDAAASWRAPVAGGPSLLHTLTSAMALLLIVQAVTGALLALYYSPSTGAAWASVAYIEDQVPFGSLVRGVHRWGMSAIVVVAGAHLVLTAVRGGYRQPRELTWWIGLALLAVMMGYSVTGFLLRWDQYGYWATKVELGYATDAPGLGRQLTQGVQGGNQFGNLTLTRFYALHAIVLPALTLGLVAAWRRAARAHGPLPARGTDAPAWPHQTFRNVVVAALVLAALVAWSIHAGGAGLDGPADPTGLYDARPQWYFRPLYALVNVAGSLRTVVALGLPLLIVGLLAALPLVDRRRPRGTVHAVAMVGLGGFFLALATLGYSSARQDRRGADAALDRRRDAIAHDARRARALAKRNGVPAPGGLAVYTTAPFYEARRLWTRECASCHAGDDRKAPVLGFGNASRAHTRSLLLNPLAPEHFGKSPKIANDENTMPAVDLPVDEVDALVELLYAESGAKDADAAKVARGQTLFDDGTCSDCHERVGTEPSTGPNLAGYGSRAYLEGMIRDPGASHRFGAMNDMPRFADELSPAQLTSLTDYLMWLRTAAPADVAALDQ